MVRFEPERLAGELAARRDGALAGMLPERFVLPQYGGRSIANVPPTVGRLLGVETGWAAPPLEEALWSPLAAGVERVILLLVDGVGWNRLWEVDQKEGGGFAARLEQWGALARPVTSVSPSTTSVATTTLWGNGAAAAEHGMVGFTFLLAEQAAVCNMLFWRAAANPGGRSGALEEWGVRPETFLPTPAVSEVLGERGIPTISIMPRPIAHSPLSRMQQRGARRVGYDNDTDLWLWLEEWLASTAGQRGYCAAYYPEFDTFSHRDGPGAPSWSALWRALRFHLDRFMDGISPAARRGTLLLVTADHGHVPSPPSRQHTLSDHPELARHLMLYPGGEPRHLYLYARSGRLQAIRDYYEARLATDFHLLESGAALQAGLYGPADRQHPDAERRLGDFVLLSKGEATFWVERPDPKLLGMHGSMEPDEMIVPFIALRLDA